MNKYYAAGNEITKDEHRAILYGERDKLIRCPDNQPGMCLAWISDHINAVYGTLDSSDPVLIELLKFIGLPLEKTYIVQIFSLPADPLTDEKKGAVYGYW